MKVYQEALVWVGYRIVVALLILASNIYYVMVVY